MSLQTRLSALATAVGADIKFLNTQLTGMGGMPVVTIDGGDTPTAPADGFTAITNGEVGPHTHSTASETVSGTAEIATQAETNAGTDDLTIVTPLKFQTRLAAFAQPLSANLTTLAGVVSGAMGRTLLGTADAAAAKTALSLSKTDVGLSNVDNTSDANKPVSTAQQTALNLKANTSALPGASSETVSGLIEIATQTETNTGTDDVRAVTPLKFQTRLAAFAQPLSSNLTTLAGVVSGAMGRTLLGTADAAAAKTALSLTKTDVGLSNVDNTSDVNKPVSTAQAASIATKLGLTAKAADSELLDGVDSVEYLRKGVDDGTGARNTKAAASLNAKLVSGWYDGSGMTGAPDANWWLILVLGHSNGSHWQRQLAFSMTSETGTQTIYSRRCNGGDPTVSGNWSAWSLIAQPLNANLTTLSSITPGATGQSLLAAGTAAAAKTTLSLAKADVGLGNVDNTSDANKPVSTSQQTALDLKANLASPALTGVPTAPTAANGTNTTQIATTAFVSASVAAGLPAIIDAGTP